MTQRSLATLVAVPLLLVLGAVAALVPLPFATYGPGLTVDVLGEEDGSEIIRVSGHRTYPADGELRMTTVFVSLPEAHKTLPELMKTWLDDDEAVYPYDAVHEKGETVEDSRIRGAIDMVSSQDQAVAVALEELGYTVSPAALVAYVEEGSPADGTLRPRDLVLAVDGKAVTTPAQVSEAVAAAGRRQKIRMRIERDGKEREVTVTPEVEDGKPRIGISLGTGYRFPFQVSVNIDSAIGGPSAGLMFSLAIYDTLTPGSLTGGHRVAGTGTVSADGTVGPIGGIQQKVAGARRDGAELFLVPADNCADALGADAGDMRLVRAATMHEARTAIEAWVADPDADLPSCEEHSTG